MKYLLFLPFFTLAACGPSPQPNPPKPAVCSADASWITSPTMPNEIAQAESFCDFYQFSWQWFLAQMSPSHVRRYKYDPVLFQNRVYQPGGGHNQCGNTPITGVDGALRAILLRAIKPSHFEEKQADGNAVYDQQGNVLYFNVLYSQQLCDAKADGFVKGTLEVKVSWRILPPHARHTYFTMQGQIPGHATDVTLGMVGIHLAIWTPNHPEMIWATWEHKSNAPLCNGSSSEKAWSFAARDAAECLKAHPQSESGPPSAECGSFKFNTPIQQRGAPAPTGIPTNVCREYAYGNQQGSSVNGNDNAANQAAIVQLNESLVGENGLLTKLPQENPMSVWANYRMIGALWTKGGADSGSPPVPSEQGAANVSSPQRGSLELTNMSMETFQQGDSSFVPNCFGCHNYTKAKPLDVSHISKFLLP